MNAVLQKLGLTAAAVRRGVEGPVSRVEGKAGAKGAGDKLANLKSAEPALLAGADAERMLHKPTAARTIPVTGPQVAPVLSDAEVERIAKALADRLKPWMKKPRRQVLAKARAEQTVYASAERQSRIPDHLRPLARVCAEAFGLTFEAMERPGRTPTQSAAKFLLRWAMVWPCGHTTSAADLLLGLSGGTCSKSAYRAIEMSQDKSDPLSGKMLLGMARVKEFLGVQEKGNHE